MLSCSLCSVYTFKPPDTFFCRFWQNLCLKKHWWHCFFSLAFPWCEIFNSSILQATGQNRRQQDKENLRLFPTQRAHLQTLGCPKRGLIARVTNQSNLILQETKSVWDKDDKRHRYLLPTQICLSWQAIFAPSIFKTKLITLVIINPRPGRCWFDGSSIAR